jgi:hypothetical protein
MLSFLPDGLVLPHITAATPESVALTSLLPLGNPQDIPGAYLKYIMPAEAADWTVREEDRQAWGADRGTRNRLHTAEICSI